MARHKGDETERLIGQQQSPDLGPLFGDEPEPAAKRAPGPAGKRYKELPASYDTLIGRHAVPTRQPTLCAMCTQTIGPLDLVRDIEHAGLRVTVHESCIDEWDAQCARERARMPESAALRGKTAPGSDTSERAARQIDSEVPTLAWLVLEHIKSCGAHGATREEVTIALGKRLSSVTARVHELFMMGHIGSNCTERCTVACEHPRQSRTNPETQMANEVMLYETHVLRWREDQSRPPVPLKHGRRRG